MIRHLTLIPLSITLLIFPSVRYTLALDGAEGKYYGFPLPWNSDSLVTSLAKDIYILPLIIDLIFFAIFGAFILKALTRLRHPLFTGSLVAIWASGLFGALLMIFFLTSNPLFKAWPDPGPFHLLEVRLGVGL
ncbi:MAG: hypothetical protein LBE21_11030 [Pseudomonadales bacterium]|jgi:hypothetical protein|nr:hypothetical protein [Pseudomonadales bacterium]